MDATYNPELCAERHEKIDNTLGCLANQITSLAASDAVHTANIANLTENLKTFRTAAWGLFASGVLALVVFILNKLL